jgi:hypothetical protein
MQRDLDGLDSRLMTLESSMTAWLENRNSALAPELIFSSGLLDFSAFK